MYRNDPMHEKLRRTSIEAGRTPFPTVDPGQKPRRGDKKKLASAT